MRVFRLIGNMLSGRKTRNSRPIMPGVWLNEPEVGIMAALNERKRDLPWQTPSIEEVD